jgi:Ca2+-binding EF-hand superfamily protein
MTEIHGLRFVERDQGYMVASRNINSSVAFSYVKGEGKNEIEKEDIARFLRDNDYDPKEEDVKGIFTRLDHNKDGKITYQDF